MASYCQMRCRTVNNVVLWRTELTTDQANVLCDVIVSQEKLVLEDIDLWQVNLRMVNAGQLSRAIVKMKKVDLTFTELSTYQLTVLCQTIVRENNMALKELRLVGDWLDRVDKGLVDRAKKVVKIVN